MIINPIIPIWLMTIVCVSFITLEIYHKQGSETTKPTDKLYWLRKGVGISLIALLFIMNLRLMVPNGEETRLNSDVSVMFAIDTSVSMRALDYQGDKERFEGVINDCCHIVDELSNCRFSLITFSNEAEKVIPFTTDADMVQAELKAMKVDDDLFAKGTSLNVVKDRLKNELEKESKSRKCVVFFITDGEITKEGETLETFSDISKYVSNGAIMGYGTQARRKNGK